MRFMTSETVSANDSPALAAIPLFKQLSPAALEKIAALMTPVSFKADDTIFLEREPGDALYVVDSGKVRIWVLDGEANQVTLSELEPGNFLGEMSLLDGGKRSASATAMVESKLHRLRREDFEEFLIDHPQATLEVM